MTGRRVLGGLLLTCLYGALFLALIHPRWRYFGTHVWADLGDGLNGVWGLWWFHKAVLDLHQSPFHTTYFHYPFGISLHMHVLVVANALPALPLWGLLGPIATYNTIVASTFVLSGLTAFALARSVVASTPAAVFAGYVFAFSSYHFAHTGAHMNLITIQWLPLFLLLWMRLLATPTGRGGGGAALALAAVYLSDYYYFAYALLAALVLACAEGVRRRSWRFATTRAHARALGAFALVFALAIGPLLFGLAQALRGDSWWGGHDPRALSLDLLAPFVPGKHSYFADGTEWYWGTAGGNPNETSVFVGLSTLALAFAARGTRRVGRWWTLVALFGVLALGPRLHVLGREIPGVLLPYGWLEAIVPGMQMTGVPARAFVMASLALAVLASAGLRRLTNWGPVGTSVAAGLASLVVIETLPGPIPTSVLPEAPFALHLRAQPDREPLLDLTDPPMPPGVRVFLQTIHEHPMAYGYTSRTPARVARGLATLQTLGAERRYRELRCEYGFRWILQNDESPVAPLAPDTIRTSVWPAERPALLHDLAKRFADCTPADVSR